MSEPTSNAQREPIRVLIAEDHTVVRQALAMLLSDAKYAIEIVGEARDGAEATRLAKQLRPDVIVMDLQMPRMDGLQAIRRITGDQKGVSILVLTSYGNEESAMSALRAGACGFLSKTASVDELVHAIRSVRINQTVLPRDLAVSLAENVVQDRQSNPPIGLTGRERDVLECLAQGMSNKEISAALSIGVATVRTHISNLLGKLGASNRTQALQIAISRGLIDQRSFEPEGKDAGA